MKKIKFLTILIFLTAALSLWAGKTAYLTLKGQGEFNRGTLKNVSIDKIGRLALSPETKEIFNNKDLLVYSIAKKDQTLYVGTGNNDTLYEVDIEKNEPKSLFKGSGLAVNNVILNGDTLYFSESPTNTVYKMNLKDKKAEKLAVFDKETYLWKMVLNQSKIYVTTGDNAKLYELDLEGNKKELFANPKENHFLGLASDGEFVYFSGEGNGALYQYNIKSGQTKSLYDAYEDEINDIYINDKKEVYFVTSCQTPKIPGTDFDFTDSFLIQMTDNERKAQEEEKRSSGQGGSKKAVVKNSLYVYKNNRVEKLFSRDNQVFYSVTEGSDGNIYVGSNNGQIYRYLVKEKKVSIFMSLKEDQILQLSKDKERIFVGTGNLGKIFAMTYAYADKGEFISRIIDLGGDSKIGSLSWEGVFPENTSIRFFIRGGNSESVDNSWTAWTGPYTNSKGSLVSVKSVRYLQYKAEFFSNDIYKTPILDSITQPFLAKNRKPSISAFRINANAGDKKSNPYQIALNWNAYDSDIDKLVFQLYFKDKDDLNWLPLTDKIYENSFTFDSRILPDGNYQFKLTVSDEMTNTPEETEISEEISQLLLIDNNPPAVKFLSSKKIGEFLRIEGVIEDDTSFVTGAYYSLNAEEWTYFVPRDGIFDSKKEYFEISIPEKELSKTGKENIIFIRAFDARDNLVTVKFKIK